ncbi:GerMN domain-containing protein [Jeotgalibaca caeni]|uniref:GerMN domain-containing protein n=1 Tax=Jeotgalibaca caeni TaxID=3028623 RepID=UPI00237D7B2E|nr:GerMN domain-containing protein [Jeotgalibaca caeni]MDE1549421.1 GerMN domain-containing protein [Jeotgalibaca caeni]
MKKKRLWALLLVTLFAAGCANTDSETETSETASVETSSESSSEESSMTSESAESSSTEETATILEYYPFDENVFYSYIGSGNEYASFDRYPQYIEGNKVQWAEKNPGTTMVTVVEYKDGQLTETFSQGETYYRENMLDKTNENAGRILLKEPLEVGNTWENPSGTTSEITAMDVEVETPLGVFPALEVTTTEENAVTKDYYSVGLGLVKEEFTDNTGGTVVSSTLQARDEEVQEMVVVKMFFPDMNAMGIETSDVNVGFSTNNVTREMLTELLRQVPNIDYGKLIPDTATINSLYLNEDGRVYVDFSKELVTDLNAGSSGESLILQGIVNTIGYYYGVEEVVLTVEGAPYESGHYSLQEGEAMKVDMENVAE